MRLCLGILFSAGIAAFGQATPTIIDAAQVGRPGMTAPVSPTVTGLNNRGRVLSFSSTGETGFVFGNVRDLDSQLSLRPGGLLPQGINRWDQIVGPASPISADSLLYKLHLLPPVTLTGVQARAINASGAATGATNSPYPQMFFYSGTVAPQPIAPLPGGIQSWGNAINSQRQIAGASGTSTGVTHAVVWDPGSGLRDVGALYGPGQSEALGINRFGEVTGFVTGLNGNPTPFRLTPGAAVVTFDPAGAFNGVATSINAAGQVVGNRFIGQDTSAFMYTPWDGPIDLNSLLPANSGWTLQTARAINDFGQIAGAGVYQGQKRAYRLSLPLCDITVTPSALTVAATANLIPISVNVGEGGCRWVAVPSDSWIRVDRNSVSPRSETLMLNIDPNTDSKSRTGSILIAGRMIPILQKGMDSRQRFTDVPANHPFFDYINYLKDAGITSGCSSTKFCPDQPITRGEMAVFVIRALIGDTFPDAPKYFTDVDATHPYYRYIQKMGELGISSGCAGEPNPKFCADAAVSRFDGSLFVIRAEFGATLPTLADLQYSAKPYFDDLGNLSQLAGYTQKMRDLGVTSGCGPRAFCPNTALTRGQAAVFVVRSLLTPIGD